METCHYCGYRYHPMPVYVRKRGVASNSSPYKIHVCDFHAEHGQLVPSDCDRQAEADGYERRKDLTPTR